MLERAVVFGDRMVPVRLPDRTQVAPAGLSLPLEPAPDLDDAVRAALERPIDRPPLRDHVRPGDRVTVAFDDATVPCYAPLWSAALWAITHELERGGVRPRDVSFVCANALHRRPTTDELARLVGDDFVRAHADRLTSHDAEDPGALVHLGDTPSGHRVEIARAVVESDLTVYLNCSTTRGFSGGWKSVCVGLSGYHSIHGHHDPDVMSMSLGRNRMHEILDEMGAVVDDALGPERVFKLETVLANPLAVHEVLGGSVAATRAAALAKLRAHQPSRRSLVDEPAQIVVYGVPDWSPYAAFSHGNPILDLVSTGLGYLGGVIEAAGAPGCTVVLASPCPLRFNDVHHPAYRVVWDDVLPHTRDPYEARATFEPELARREDLVARYRHAHAFHPAHAVMALYPLKRLRHAARVIVAGARDPSVPERLGFDHAPTVEDALARAEEHHGRDAPVAFVDYPLAFNRA